MVQPRLMTMGEARGATTDTIDRKIYGRIGAISIGTSMTYGPIDATSAQTGEISLEIIGM